MSSAKTYSDREIHSILRKNGYKMDRQSSTSHQVWIKEENGDEISLRFRSINKMIWRRICREHNLVILK